MWSSICRTRDEKRDNYFDLAASLNVISPLRAELNKKVAVCDFKLLEKIRPNFISRNRFKVPPLVFPGIRGDRRSLP